MSGGPPGQAPVLLRAADAAAVARAAADDLARRAEEAVRARGAFSLALSGGSTPRALFQLLADPAAPYRARIPWSAVHVFFGDERAVPPDHPDSNYRMAREALLDHVAVASVHRIEGERGAAAAADRYQGDLERHFAGAPPALDLVLLGLGKDGHTASLFPGSPALEERVRWAVAAAPGLPPPRERITLTLPVLDLARAAVFLVAGGDKAGALRRLLRPRPGEAPVPASRVAPRGALLVLADEAALAEVDGAGM